MIADVDKTALVIEDERISYHTLKQKIYQFSLKLFVNPGDRVMVYSENRVGYVYALYAIWYKKAIYSTWFNNLDDVMLIGAMKQIGPTAIFASRRTCEQVKYVIEMLNADISVIVIEDIEEIEPDIDTPEAIIDNDANDIAATVFTAGITSYHKPVNLLFANLLTSSLNTINAKLVLESDVFLVLLQFCNTWALFSTVIVPLFIGATCVFGTGNTGETIISRMHEQKVTVFVCVNYLYFEVLRVLMEEVNGNYISRIKYSIAGKIRNAWVSKLLFRNIHKSFGGAFRYFLTIGTKVPKEIFIPLLNLGFEVLEGYGLAEAASIVTIPASKRYDVDSVGKVFDGISIKIVQNEIVIKGANITPSYHNHPAYNDKFINNGWLFTNDIGHIDAKGRLYIERITTDILQTNDGKLINASGVENSILRYNNIIAEAGVYYADGRLKVTILPQKSISEQFENDEDGLVDYIRWNSIEYYNYTVKPYLRIRQMTLYDKKLPRSTSGKLKRYLLQTFEKENTKGMFHIDI